MESAQRGDVRDGPGAGVGIADEQLRRHFQPFVRQVAVRGHTQFLLEELSQIIIAEGQGMQVGIQLIGAVSIV